MFSLRADSDDSTEPADKVVAVIKTSGYAAIRTKLSDVD